MSPPSGAVFGRTLAADGASPRCNAGCYSADEGNRTCALSRLYYCITHIALYIVYGAHHRFWTTSSHHSMRKTRAYWEHLTIAGDKTNTKLMLPTYTAHTALPEFGRATRDLHSQKVATSLYICMRTPTRAFKSPSKCSSANFIHTIGHQPIGLQLIFRCTARAPNSRVLAESKNTFGYIPEHTTHTHTHIAHRTSCRFHIRTFRFLTTKKPRAQI